MDTCIPNNQGCRSLLLLDTSRAAPFPSVWVNHLRVVSDFWHLVTDEEIKTGSFFTDNLLPDSGRWGRKCAAPPCTAQMIFHSSNTWVGHKKDYVQTSTSIQTNNRVVSGLDLSSCAFCVESLNQTACFLWQLYLNRQDCLLGSPIRLELIDCRKHRQWVHRPSYYWFPCHHQSIDRCWSAECSYYSFYYL